MSYYKTNPRKLTDGREVIGTLSAAYEVGITPAYFPTVAKREGLQRFASRNQKGAVAYFWLVSEVEALKSKRQALEPDVPFDEVVPLPFDAQAQTDGQGA